MLFSFLELLTYFVSYSIVNYDFLLGMVCLPFLDHKSCNPGKNTAAVLNGDPQMQQAYGQCTQQEKHERGYADFEKYFSKKKCDSEALVSEYKKVIVSQHSINNVVTTLEEPQYKNIANLIF